MVWIRVLGAFEAEVGGVPAGLGGPRQRAVLALLVAARGAVVPVDRLIEDLWRGEPPGRAVASLQAYVSNLRRLLEPGRAPRTPARLLVSAPPGYALRLPDGAVDAWRFERLLHEAREASRPVPLLDEALALWRGPAFAEAADEPWARDEIARLEELRSAALELRTAAVLRAGDTAEAVAAAERLTRDGPLREEGWRLHALALWAAGRQGDALATLRRARSVLAEELGLDPGAALAGVEAAILGQRDAELRASIGPATPANAVTPASATNPATAAPSTTAATETAPAAPASDPAGAELFVGRDAELGALARTAREAAGGMVRVVLATGEAGMGKSALLSRLAGDLASSGWLVAAGRCPEEAGAPPAWAWSEALRAVAREVPPPSGGALAPLLPDGPDAHGGPETRGAVDERGAVGGRGVAGGGDAAAGRFRLHRALWAWLGEAARRRPLAILLDDLHWADDATLAPLALAATAEPAPILVVAAFRAEDAGADGRLDATLAALARRSPLRLALTGLPVAAVARLVAAECAQPVDGATVAALADRTGGNPFYVRESARLLSGEGALVATSEVPEGVRDVLRRRLARLPEAAVAVLRLAAVAGHDARVDLLVAAADAGEDAVLDALDAGIVAGLLAEPDPGRVRFAHALARDTLIADLSGLRRARMHARIAAALERLDPGDVPALAHHFGSAATAATAAKAVRYAVRAAELAEERYAHATAAGLLTGALAAFELIPAAERAHATAGRGDADGGRGVGGRGDADGGRGDADGGRVELLGRLLRAQVRAGDLTAARATRQRAVDLAEAAHRDDLLLAAFTAWTEPTPWQPRPHGTVDRRIVEPMRRLLDGDGMEPAVRCRLLDAYAAELIGTGDPSARAAAEEAVAIAARLGDPRLRALAVTTLAHELTGTADRARLARELLDLGTEHDLPTARWTGLFDLACAAVVDGDPEETARLVHEAAGVAERYRMAEAALVTDCALATLAAVAGRFDDAARRYDAVTGAMARLGSLHAAGFAFLVRASLAVEQGTLAALLEAPDAAEHVSAEHVFAEHGPIVADVLAAVLAAGGHRDEARAMLARAVPAVPDYFFTLFTTFRALTAISLGDRDAAEDTYAALLPSEDGPPAGLESLSVALRPVQQTLGELALLLGRADDAARHFAAALETGERWGAPHWIASARTALDA